MSDTGITLTPKESEARKMLCLPLDGLNTFEEIKTLVSELSPYVGIFKIGKETFTRFGPESVRLVKSLGSDVFLDLKYHDIPNTVKGAAKAAAEIGVYMFNVHASGGKEMMRAAAAGADEAVRERGCRKPKIIAVTILTSIDKAIMNGEIGINGPVEEQVLKLARNASETGMDGIVCSAADLYAIKNKLPEGFMYVTPGIAGPNQKAGADQKRVFTPGNAVKDGASILVVGRAITGAPDRRNSALEVLQDMAKEL